MDQMTEIKMLTLHYFYMRPFFKKSSDLELQVEGFWKTDCCFCFHYFFLISVWNVTWLLRSLHNMNCTENPSFL